MTFCFEILSHFLLWAKHLSILPRSNNQVSNRNSLLNRDYVRKHICIFPDYSLIHKSKKRPLFLITFIITTA